MRDLRDEPMAPRTTLHIGGAARRLIEIDSEPEALSVLGELRARRAPFFVLGGGSNMVVADEGIDLPVLALRTRAVEETPVRADDGVDRVEVTAAAGEPWDALVETCTAEGLSGIECLSGIPGLVGAAPIQNIGAYGQQISDCLTRVRVYDLARDTVEDIAAERCALGYRDSAFKRAWRGRYVVLGVALALRRAPAAPPRYAELRQALQDRGAREGQPPPPDEVRQVVLALRRRKAMVIDPAEPDSRSAGSFFINPVVDQRGIEAIEQRGRAAGLLGPDDALPRFDAGEQRVKVPAAWLIERAGFARGFGAGAVGLSRKHTLAIVNRGGASAVALVALARTIRDGVRERFGVTLVPEPVFVGFQADSLPLARPLPPFSPAELIPAGR